MLKKIAPVLAIAGVAVALVAALLASPKVFQLSVDAGGLPTADPGLALKSPRQMIVVLALASLLIALLVRRFRDKIPSIVALVLDLLPLAWMFFFVWSMVHNVSALIPARTHPMFNRNAIAAAGLATFMAALVPRKWRGQGVGGFGLFLSFLATCDILHMRIFGNVIPFGSHGSLTQLWDVRASIASLFEKRDAWMLVYVATSATMLGLWRVKVIDNLKVVRILGYLVPVAALSFTIGPVQKDVAEFLDSKWAKEVLNREDQVWNAGFFEAHIREISLNIKNSLGKKKPTTAELEEVQAYYRTEHAEHDMDTRASFGKYKGKNVLIVQLEAFERWLIGAKVNGQEVTPFLNKLRDQGVFYPDIFDIAAQSHTADCEYLVLNSNHPLPDAPVAFRAEDNHFVTLATTLRDAGYSTLSMHGYRRGMWNRAVLHPRYGFTHSLFAEELGEDPRVGWGLDDHTFFQKLVVAAKKERAPWLLYAITLSSHHPYSDIPYNRRRLRLGRLENTMVGGYLHSAAFVDDAVSQLFDQLRAADLLRDTMVVLYGDHAALIQSSPRDRATLASSTNLSKDTTDHIGTGSINRVPLLVLLPQSQTPQVAHVTGSQMDVGPTILHYLGVEPPRSFMGHPLLPEDVGGFVARWDGSFVAPPLMFDAGLDECRVLSDYRLLPAQDCRALADKARKQLDMSWFVTNNDLARRLVEKAEPLQPVASAPQPLTIGRTCHDEAECKGAEGFDVHCIRGLCVTDPHGPCPSPGSTAPCALGTACAKVEADLDSCVASCDVFACGGSCNEAGLCVPAP